MTSALLRPTLVLAVTLAAGMATSAFAQNSASASSSTGDLKARCDQLISYFDRYGASRGENSDGPRNHTRIGAAIECERTHMRVGVKTMEALLKRKAFDLPAPGTPEVEPEDIEAPDITRPVSQRY